MLALKLLSPVSARPDVVAFPEPGSRRCPELHRGLRELGEKDAYLSRSAVRHSDIGNSVAVEVARGRGEVTREGRGSRRTGGQGESSITIA